MDSSARIPTGADKNDNLNAYFTALIGHLKTLAREPNKTGVSEVRATFEKLQDVNATENITFKWWCTSVHVQFSSHHEYYSISSYIDFSPRPPISTQQMELCDEPNIKAALDAFFALNHFLRMPAYLNRTPQNRAALSKLAEVLQCDLLEAFFFKILSAPMHADVVLANLFADFRGIVLGSPIDMTSVNGPDAKVSNEHDVAQGEKKFEAPFWYDENTARRYSSEESLYRDASQWDELFGEIWPYVTAPIRGMDLSDYEFTSSLLKRRRALYISALGAQPHHKGKFKRVPLFYLVFVDHLGGWAVGDLIDRLHHQGTLRLAALLWLPSLENAADKLSQAELALETASTKPTPSHSFKGANLARTKISLQQQRAALEEIEEKLKEADGVVPGGIQYRIERSVYYIEQFRAGISALEIDNVGDAKQYDDFVERRLGSTFAYIGMLRSRYETVRREKESIYQKYLTNETRQLTASIEDLQRGAEFITIGGLLPYYISSILAHAIWGDHDGPRELWRITFFVFLTFAIARWTPEESQRWGKRLTLGVLCILGASWLALNYMNIMRFGRAAIEGRPTAIEPMNEARPPLLPI